MIIVVCIKQVPDNAQVKMDAATGTLKLEGVDRIVNPFDEYALEEGLRIREKHSGKVILLTMGPADAVRALREGISLGADQAVLCSDSAFEQYDTNATAKILAKAIGKIRETEGTVDMVLLGRQSMDGDTAQMGAQLSVHLGVPAVLYVKKFEEIMPSSVKVHRMTEEGYDQILCPLPAVFGTVKEINVPRLPSLKGKLRAKDALIPTWTAKDLGTAVSVAVVAEMVPPPKRPSGKILNGEPATMVEELISDLRLRHLV